MWCQKDNVGIVSGKIIAALYSMSHKSGATKEKGKTRNIRVIEITLTFLGLGFFVDHTWTDRSGLMGAAG